MNQIVVFSWDKIKVYLKKFWWLLLGVFLCIILVGYIKVSKNIGYPEKYMVTKQFLVKNISETTNLEIVKNNLISYVALEEVTEEINAVLSKNGFDRISKERDAIAINRNENSSVIVLQAVSNDTERAAVLADAYEEKLVLLENDIIMGTGLTKIGEMEAVPCYLLPSGKWAENIDDTGADFDFPDFLISIEGIAIIICALIVDACLLLAIILFDKKIRWMPEIEKLFDIKYLGNWENEQTKIEKQMQFLDKKYNNSILIYADDCDLSAETKTVIRAVALDEYVAMQIAEITGKTVILAISKKKTRYGNLSAMFQQVLDYDGKVIAYISI